MVVALEYWALMSAVVGADAAATPVVIAFLMALEKAVTSLSIILVLRVLVLSSSLSGALFFDPRVSIVLVLRGFNKLLFTGVYGRLRAFTEFKVLE